MAQGRRSYTDEQVADVLVRVEQHAGSARAVSRATGIPVMTVQQWSAGTNRAIDGESALAAREALVSTQKAQDAQDWRKVLDAARQRVLETIHLASARDAGWIAGVAQDKVTLLTGGATRRVEHQVSLSDYYRGELTRPKVVEALPARVETDAVSEGEEG